MPATGNDRPTTNRELLDALDGVRKSIETANDSLKTKASRRSLHLTAASVLLSLAVAAGGTGWAWYERRELCKNANESREIVRGIGVDLSVSDAESIIEVAGDEISPELARRFLETQRRNAEEIVAQLEDREC